MCDQDHFDKDLEEYEARGLVTRKQFGVMLGAGIAMLLPKVANAAAVTESDVNVKTPDGTADCYFVHPASGTAPGVLMWPDIFGLRPAFRQMGKRLAESGYSVLVVNPFYRVKKAPTAEQGAATPIQGLMPLMQALNETTHMTDAKAFIGWLDTQAPVAKNRKMGTQGYCMGGPIAFRTAAADARSRRSRRLIPWRRAGDQCAEQSAPAGREDQGAVPHRDRGKRRQAGSERQDRNEGHVRQGGPACGDRSVRRVHAWLVPTRFYGLQRATGREGLEPFARAVRKSSGLSRVFAWGCVETRTGRLTIGRRLATCPTVHRTVVQLSVGVFSR